MKNSFRNLICIIIILFFIAVFNSCKNNSNPFVPFPTPQIAFDDPISYNVVGKGIISFERIDTPYSSGICIIDAQNKTKKVFSGDFDGPAISPDGNKVAFSRSYLFNIDIYTMKIDGSDLKNIASIEGVNYNPSWSNDSKNVLFINYDGPKTLRILYENNSILYKSDMYFIPESPFSSFEGKGMIYYGYNDVEVDKNKSISFFNPETKNISTICKTTETGEIYTPRWSPDGNQIAFVQTKSNTNWEIVIQIYNVLTHKLKIIYEWKDTVHNDYGSNSNNQLSVCWSPDGNKLAFNKTENGYGSHIYLINSDGTGLTQITSEPGVCDRSVSWSK